MERPITSHIPAVVRHPDGAFLTTGLTWTSDRLRVLGDIPPEGRYVTVLPVRDYPRLAAHGDEPGCLSRLTDADRASLAAGRTCLTLDLSNEGPALHRALFDDLHAQLQAQGIERGRVSFVSQNRRIGHDYRRTYGRGLRFWSFDFFPKAIAAWFDAERGRAVFGDTAFDPGSYAPLEEGRDGPVFLCQSSAVRWHRALLYRWLQLGGLQADGLISFHGLTSDNPKGGEIDIAAPPADIAAAFPELVAGIARWLPRRVERFDQRQAFGNDLVLTIEADAYARTLFSIVPETDFFLPGIERITEKALKAMAMGHPTIVLGAPRSLAFLRELGFTTFDGLIDPGYDSLEDPAERMRAVFEAIQASHGAAKGRPDRWRRAAREEALANVEHARRTLLGRFDRLVSDPLMARMEAFLETGLVE